jgi:hypothetical protein
MGPSREADPPNKLVTRGTRDMCPASYETKTAWSNPSKQNEPAYPRPSLTGPTCKTYRYILMGLVRLHLLAATLTLAAFAPSAWAGRNDLQLLNLCPSAPSVLNAPECSWVQRQADGWIRAPVVPDLNGGQAFRSLMSELGVVLAPRIPMTADTGGIAGFQISAEFGMTQISHNRSFWNGVAGVSANNPAATRPDAQLTTVGAFVRKGIWLPVPTIELGLGAVHLLESHLLAWQGYAKLAIHEGFDDWLIPSVAIRGAVSYLTGTSQVTMTTATLDLLVSKGFGLLKTARLEPFAGGGLIAIFAHGGRIDATPSCDASKLAAMPAGSDPGTRYCASSQAGTKNDLDANFSFPAQNAITRYRIFAGLKLRFAAVFFSAQYELYFAGASRGASATVQSAIQNALSLSTGLHF